MHMAEGNMNPGMTENDITALTEALHAQQQLLQMLYAELDKEREASASATSEALSMILRLQGEKAATKMEASQYKRLAEEKMFHAEESLAIFEDVIYQKELEIASLEFQVQAYRCKLLSIGCSDLGPDNLLLPGNDQCKGETSFSSSTIKRLQSLPQIQFKDFQKVEQKADQESNIHQLMNAEKRPGNSSGGSFNLYWEQIRRLDERVKEISYSKESCKSAFRTCSLPSPMSMSTYDSVKHEIVAQLDQVKEDNILSGEATVSTPSSGIHDVFEVPKSYEHQDKEHSKLTVQEGKKQLVKQDLVYEGNGGKCFNDEIDCVKNILRYTVHEKKVSKPSDEGNKKLPKPKDDKIVSCSVGLARTITDINDSQAKLQVLNERVRRLERQGNSTRQEISHAGEEIKLLKEIQEQLNLIQAEIYNWRTKKSPPQEEKSLHSLMEACLYSFVIAQFNIYSFDIHGLEIILKGLCTC